MATSLDGVDTASLSLPEIAAALRGAPALVRQLISGLPGGATRYHPAPGRWCINEVVGHLIEEDNRDFVGRIRAMIEGHEPMLTVTDQDAVARMRQDCARDTEELLAQFATVRAASIEYVGRIQPDALHRCGIHPVIGRLEIVHVLHEWIYHDLNHVKQIAGNVQHRLWGQLGAMQEFYVPASVKAKEHSGS